MVDALLCGEELWVVGDGSSRWVDVNAGVPRHALPREHGI